MLLTCTLDVVWYNVSKRLKIKDPPGKSEEDPNENQATDPADTTNKTTNASKLVFVCGKIADFKKLVYFIVIIGIPVFIVLMTFVAAVSSGSNTRAYGGE